MKEGQDFAGDQWDQSMTMKNSLTTIFRHHKLNQPLILQ